MGSIPSSGTILRFAQPGAVIGHQALGRRRGAARPSGSIPFQRSFASLSLVPSSVIGRSAVAAPRESARGAEAACYDDGCVNWTDDAADRARRHQVQNILVEVLVGLMTGLGIQSNSAAGSGLRLRCAITFGLTGRVRYSVTHRQQPIV